MLTILTFIKILIYINDYISFLENLVSDVKNKDKRAWIGGKKIMKFKESIMFDKLIGGIKGLYIGSCLSILDEYPSHVYYQKILETVYVSLTRSIFENLCIHKKKTDEELIQIINDEYVNWLKKTEKFFSKQHLLYKILCLPIVFGMDITKTPHDLGKIAFEANKDVDIDVAILSYLMVNFLILPYFLTRFVS